MTDSATQSASPPVKDCHGSDTHRSSVRSQTEFFFGLARTAEKFCASREPFSPREKDDPSPFAEKISAAHVTRHGDIPFCMSKPSKTCAS